MSSVPELLKRLAAIDAASTSVDRERAERAVEEHFKQLKLPLRSLRWVVDGPSGFREILSQGWEREQRRSPEETSGTELLDRVEKSVGETRDSAYIARLKPLLPESRYSEPLADFDKLSAMT